MLDILFITIALIWLSFASVTDLRKREVPDWLSYSLISIGFGLRLMYSISFNDWHYLLYGLLGFSIMLGIGLLMYRARQWGGGDAKLAMGLGVVFATSIADYFLINLIINIFVIGAIYGLIWCTVLAIKNKKRVIAELKTLLKKRKRQRWIVLSISITGLVVFFLIHNYFIKMILALSIIFILVYQYLFIYVKSVENCCMYKFIPASKLLEGDWLARDVVVKNKLICSSKCLGLDKKNIKEIINSGVDRVLIKQGIPFVPPFLIAVVLTLIYGNILLLLI